MRIDKYLKVARITKRRIIAKELGDNQRLFINGKQAKASSEVKVNDEIEIHYGNRHLTIRVVAIKNQIKKTDDPLFEIIEEKIIH